ncbi:conserved hypothetical protein [Ricinus communis]|uniref:Uncharacterized protein n=1 Tax=Ricinus communis TaxID=3988 RepID=B9SQK9_RICCO|nr:conserved hypothetical protein [Ricinus communis]
MERIGGDIIMSPDSFNKKGDNYPRSKGERTSLTVKDLCEVTGKDRGWNMSKKRKVKKEPSIKVLKNML